MTKLFKNTAIVLVVVGLMVFFVYFYSAQTLIRFYWCENCQLGMGRVVTISCTGLKLQDRVIIKVGCNSFPI